MAQIVGGALQLDVPVLPLRDFVAFPHATGPFTVVRPRSSRLIEALPAAESQREVLLVLQRSVGHEDPLVADLHGIGTLARIIHVSSVKKEETEYFVLAAGIQRARLLQETSREPFLRAKVELLSDLVPAVADPEYLALAATVRKLFAGFVEKSPQLSNELVTIVAEIEDAAFLSDVISAAMPLGTGTRQQLLATLDVRERLRCLAEELMKENEKLDIERKIQSDLREKVAGAQREYFLREQLKAIERELGEGSEDGGRVEDLRRRIDEVGLPLEARKEALRELSRLRQIPAMSPEYSVTRNYLDWIAALPWGRSSGAPIDLERAKIVLDEDHYDLERIKERILEYLAVLQLRGDMRAPVLCLAGPPGVGKTSLGRSIARALGRSYARLSLGGVHDEAELRGHRRTYIGAMPGQIIQAFRRAGANDPVIMLDEIDKLGRDHRGDPAAALLEILDPEQNSTFRDHYLDLPFDLSKALFIATANVLDSIPAPLLDRLEIIELSGYSEEDKLHIARRYLVPKQTRENGLAAEGQIRFTDPALRELVRHYTREAGVRGLERQIGAICRKRARRVAAGEQEVMVVTPEAVRGELGAQRHRIDTELAQRTARAGVAVGLAWTPTGGDVLFIEATRVSGGRGTLTLTGQLGGVMQESAKAGVTWLRANAHAFSVDSAEFNDWDLHIHVPAGAVPKDGPSAGVVIVAAVASALTGRTVRPEVAMTGEITLSGDVLPVGGIRDKVLAAKRSGIREIVLPERNEVNLLEDVPAALREGLVFHFVASIEEALEHAFGAHPVLLPGVDVAVRDALATTH
jgi:ATP-dependent Lon protease